ncbi:MAG: methyl-accepting chemotaxis protein [Pseudomonadota bacterium]|nr:methyl-accepting chemotaxis protein [Pseudomonadota bacterium]
MRVNEPVTDAEYVLPDGEVIITHTDPTSRITYANPAFLRSSGFALEECMGQPQNLVRHPDMPREAFADLWSTIKAGETWSGLVKNRRKDGGFYWVRANVTPMIQQGRISGFMSVRTKPGRDEIQAAERLYASMRAGQARHLQLRRGELINVTALGALKRAFAPSLKSGTWVVIGFIALLLMGLGTAEALARGLGISAALHFLGAAVALCNLFYVQSQVVQPILRLRRIALAMISGDTRTRIQAEGVTCVVNLANGFEQMRVKLDGVLKDNLDAAGQVRTSVSTVVKSSGDLSSRTTETAASLEQTAASLEQLTATVQRNTDSARHAAELASSASKSTMQGRDVVSEVHKTMAAISDSSKRINDIVTIIDSIAFQTNLLALNAAVEAARAGDQGRGFAVVAQEVRSLAQRSAASAKDIRELIVSSRETVDRGGELANRAQASMSEVVQSVKRVADVIGEIESASREQSVGIEQINKAMTQMDEITQRDAHMAQDLIATAEHLEGESQQMLAAMSSFSMSEHRVDAIAPGPQARRAEEVTYEVTRAA